MFQFNGTAGSLSKEEEFTVQLLKLLSSAVVSKDKSKIFAVGKILDNLKVIAKQQVKEEQALKKKNQTDILSAIAGKRPAKKSC
jgi:hypothetical protein